MATQPSVSDHSLCTYLAFENAILKQSTRERKLIADIKEILTQYRAQLQRYELCNAENITLQNEMSSLKVENREKEKQVRTLRAELEDARTQLREQLTQNGAYKADLDAAEKRLITVKNLLKNDFDNLPSSSADVLAFLKEPTLVRVHSTRLAKKNNVQVYAESTSDSIDYDQTGDSMDLDDDELSRSDKNTRLSASHRHQQSLKRDRLHASVIEEEQDENIPPRKRSPPAQEITATTVVTVDPEGVRPSRARVTIKRSLNRSMSEGRILDSKDETPKFNAIKNTPRTLSTMDLRRTNAATPTWIRSDQIAHREHVFEKLSSYFKITACDVCRGGINFAAKPAVKCSDCQQHVHVSCKRKLPMPCVPRLATPVKTPNKVKGQLVTYRLKDFCPSSAPMIASPIIHCVVALENAGLHQEGLYRIPGKKSMVTSVLNEFRTSRSIPNLSLQDSEVICGVIKQFLRELRDPLIPRSSREEFIHAVQTQNFAALNTAIFDLPQPNRDTLAYLILHWQKVIAECQFNKMPKANVARCVAISVMGDGSTGRGDMMTNAARDTADREQVLMELLEMDAEYWKRFIFPPKSSASNNLRSTHRPTSREVSRAGNTSILGPLSPERSYISKSGGSRSTQKFFARP